MSTLDVSVEVILDAIVEAVEAEVGGGTLSEVKSVVRGDRARPMPPLPSVWIVPQVATQDEATYGEETWTLPVSVSALVKGDSPAEAGRSSQRFTALARTAALGAEAAMEAAGAEVTMIRSTTFDPTARSSERNRNLFWTEATVAVTFTVREE